MKHDLHEPYEFFEYVRVDDAPVPAAARDRIDIALLDMNHAWPNIGHDALVHLVLEIAESQKEVLREIGAKVRVISYDVRRRNAIPEPPGGRFRIYVGTGGPGHLDPRMNNGANEWSQGVTETAEWEAPLFRLFDGIASSPDAALLAVCHSFGLICRWSGIAQPRLRPAKSTGMPLNRLSPEALEHPWFAGFARELPDHEHFRVVDNRLFDLVLEQPGSATPIAFEDGTADVLTVVELARDRDGTMPRVLAMNHHPEILDRAHIMEVLDEKRAHGEVSEQWYIERTSTIRDLFRGPREWQSRLTSRYTFLAPLRFHIERAIREHS